VTSADTLRRHAATFAAIGNGKAYADLHIAADDLERLQALADGRAETILDLGARLSACESALREARP